MGMVLTEILDPRDNLEKATRDEVWDFCKANGLDFDQATTPKPIMVKILRQKGLVNITVAKRVMGRPVEEAITQSAHEVDATEDLYRQWQEQKAKPKDEPLTMGALRKELKARGIKFDRTEKMAALREKLSEQNAA